VAFDDPRFDFFATRHPRAHLHLSGPEETAAQYVIHAEGELGFMLGEFFGTIDVRIESDRIILDEAVHESRTVVDNETYAWRLFVDTCAGETDDWAEHDGFLAEFAPANIDRMLITYARRAAAVADLETETSTVPSAAELAADVSAVCNA